MISIYFKKTHMISYVLNGQKKYLNISLLSDIEFNLQKQNDKLN